MRTHSLQMPPQAGPSARRFGATQARKLALSCAVPGGSARHTPSSCTFCSRRACKRQFQPSVEPARGYVRACTVRFTLENFWQAKFGRAIGLIIDLTNSDRYYNGLPLSLPQWSPSLSLHLYTTALSVCIHFQARGHLTHTHTPYNTHTHTLSLPLSFSQVLPNSKRAASRIFESAKRDTRWCQNAPV